MIAGSIPLNKGPDGNSVILDAPEGLIVIDTGRHPAHAAKILSFAKERGRPVAAVINTHWHLDHTTGNMDIHEAYPNAEVFGTAAIEGALVDFLNRDREQVDRRLADPRTPEDEKAEMIRTRLRLDNPDTLRPTLTVLRSANLNIAGRSLDVRVAQFAATEADLWIYDPEAKLAIVGDLVVGVVPFMDTACPAGWEAALDEIERTPFQTLIPGHGAVMDRADFTAWRTAFSNFLACGRSNADEAQCVDGWAKDAAPFIPESHRAYARDAAQYYITTRLRSSAEERGRYCRPLNRRARLGAEQCASSSGPSLSALENARVNKISVASVASPVPSEHHHDSLSIGFAGHKHLQTMLRVFRKHKKS